jgi:hypothetical protein
MSCCYKYQKWIKCNKRRAITLAKINHREIGIICACSDHGQPRYQIWIKCDKRQMTSCVHKMWERTYCQINMKRAITLTKINCLLSHFIHIWYLDCPWSGHAHIIPISRMVDFCESYSPFHVYLTICPFPHLVYTTSHLSFVTLIWIKCDKRKMTSCVHKVWEWMYGQTNMKRATTLAKINQPWNR